MSDGNNEIKLGDEVVLGSNPTRMMVEGIDGDNVTCVWLDDKKNQKRGDFKIHVLRKAGKRVLGPRVF